MTGKFADSPPDVLVVGAGFAGMYLLHRLRQAGLTAQLLEAGHGVGGTWYWNRYPGARCDIESMQYSYQFDDALQQEWQWTERYAAQPEILRYAEHVAGRFDLLRDIRFNSRVSSAVFDEPNARWTLTCDNNLVFSAPFCVMATGCLSKPNWPEIKGLSDFKGQLLHTATWPHEPVNFHDKRVAVIGTGSSGIQSIPVIARQASTLYVFQRTANYSVPAHNRPSDTDYVREVKADYAALRARAKLNFPGIDGDYNKSSALAASDEDRTAAYEARWQQGGLTFMGAFGDLMLNKEANDTVADFVRNKIRTTVRDPQVAATLCPDNIIGGKRVCVDSNYYDTFNQDHVRLFDVRQTPIDQFTGQGVQINGELIEVDSIVVATGFDAMTGALNSMDIRGRNGTSLQAQWADGPSSYLGLAMAGFPNLFTVTGPGSPSVFTNMLPTIEQHVEWIVDCLQHAAQSGTELVEAELGAQEQWWSHCQEVASAGLKASTDSWYMGANVAGKARVFMPYFGGFPAYCQKCEEVVANGYEGFRFESRPANVD